MFALIAFFGDAGLHRLVASWPWLAAHARVIPAGTVGLAAIYQLTPLKDACLRACRHPGAYLLRFYRSGAVGGLRLGLGHALFCLGCCWALMLVMFAAGIAHLYWMALLALIMLIEKTFPNGDRLVYPVGAIFALLSLTALLRPWPSAKPRRAPCPNSGARRDRPKLNPGYELHHRPPPRIPVRLSVFPPERL